LYVRQNGEGPQSPMNGEECLDAVDACTILVSAGEASYLGANTEDTKIFYRENEDLYEYNLMAGRVSGQTTALTNDGKVRRAKRLAAHPEGPRGRARNPRTGRAHDGLI